MRLYLDEVIAPDVAAGLRERGHDVVAAAESDALGVSDAAQLARAIHDERALVTCNIADFVALARAAASRGQDHFGIVLIHARSLPPSRIGTLVRALDALLSERTARDALRNQTIFLPSPED